MPQQESLDRKDSEHYDSHRSNHVAMKEVDIKDGKLNSDSGRGVQNSENLSEKHLSFSNSLNRPSPAARSRSSPPANDSLVIHAQQSPTSTSSFSPLSSPASLGQYGMSTPRPPKRPMAVSPIMPPPFSPLSIAIPPNSPQVGKRRRVSQKWGSLINNLLAAVAQQTPVDQDGKGGESPAAIPDSPGSLLALTSDVASELGNKIAALRKRRYSQNPTREMQLMRVTTNPQYWNSTWSIRTDCCNPILLQNQSKPFRRADELVSIHLQTNDIVGASVSVWVQNPLRERRVLLEGEWTLPTSLHIDLNKRAVPESVDRFFAACVKSKRRAERAFMLGVTVASTEGQCSFSIKIDVRAAWRIPDPATLLTEAATSSALENSVMKELKESSENKLEAGDGQASVSGDEKAQSEESKRAPSSCHQCKSCHIYFANCTGVLSRNRKCKKRFCYRCIHKYRDLYSELPTINGPNGPNGPADPSVPGNPAPTWMCPSCRGICVCMACRRRRYSEQNGGAPRTGTGLSSLAAAAAAVTPENGKDDEDTDDEPAEEEEEERSPIEPGSAGIPDDDYISFDEDSEDEPATPPDGDGEQPQTPVVPAEFHEHAEWEECHCYEDLLNTYDSELGPKATEDFMMEAGLPLLDQYLCEAFTAAAVTALAKARAAWPKGKRFRGQLEPLGTAMTEAALFESVATPELGKFERFPRKYEEKPHKSQEKTVLKQLFTPKLVNALENKGLKSALMRLGLQIPKNKAMMKEILLRVGKTGTRDGEVKARPRGRPMGSFKQPVRKSKWSSPIDSPTS